MKRTAFLMLLWAGAAAAQPTDTTPIPIPEPRAIPENPIAPHDMPNSSFEPSNDATRDYRVAINKMLNRMSARYTGHADRDYVVHTIAQHQGAIEMCEAELKYGGDMELKQLCFHIIADGRHDIDELQAWLAQHKSRK
jgi:uncharacterized protein (DUF305 family)